MLQNLLNRPDLLLRERPTSAIGHSSRVPLVANAHDGTGQGWLAQHPGDGEISQRVLIIPRDRLQALANIFHVCSNARSIRNRWPARCR